MRFVAALGAGIAAVWLGVAHIIGALVRRVGTVARDLDPEHRRDGVGLGLVGMAIVIAAAVWWQLPGAVGDGIRTVVEGSVGIAAYAVPILLIGAAWRAMRNRSSTVPPDARWSAGSPSASEYSDSSTSRTVCLGPAAANMQCGMQAGRSGTSARR